MNEITYPLFMFFVILYLTGLTVGWVWFRTEVYTEIPELNVRDKDFWLILGSGLIWPALIVMKIIRRLARFFGKRP